MRFDYSKIEEKALPHFKGGEKELNAKMFADANNKILNAIEREISLER